MFLGKVEVLEEYDRDIRSINLVIKIPAVVAAARAPPPRTAGEVQPCVNIYARDNYKCQYCGKRALISELTYDHARPTCAMVG